MNWYRYIENWYDVILLFLIDKGFKKYKFIDVGKEKIDMFRRFKIGGGLVFFFLIVLEDVLM